MGNQKLLFLALGVIVVGIVGFVLVRGSNTQNQPESVQNTETSQTASDVKGAQEDKDNTSTALKDRYLTYSEENLARATENNGKAVVFFAASWCPMCIEAEKDFKANFGNVPSDVTILKTDYDASSDLKAKYNITMQDTFVQVDKDGNEITKWNSGGEGIKTLLANIQ